MFELTEYGQPLISMNKVAAILELLPYEYMEIDVSIHVFHDVESICEQLDFMGMMKLMQTRENGAFWHNERAILLFVPFMNEEVLELNFLAVLLHELRHAWQWAYKTKAFENNRANYVYPSVSLEGYRRQWMELDANRFARNFLHTYKGRINKYFTLREWVLGKNLLDSVEVA